MLPKQPIFCEQTPEACFPIMPMRNMVISGRNPELGFNTVLDVHPLQIQTLPEVHMFLTL